MKGMKMEKRDLLKLTITVDGAGGQRLSLCVYACVSFEAKRKILFWLVEAAMRTRGQGVRVCEGVETKDTQ